MRADNYSYLYLPFHFDVDPDSIFHFITDPDPKFPYDAIFTYIQIKIILVRIRIQIPFLI